MSSDGRLLHGDALGRGCASRAVCPAARSCLDSRQGLWHADAATCQNSREVPQIADEFRHASSPGCAPNFLQNQHIQALSGLDRTQEVAGSSPASSIRRTLVCAGLPSFLEADELESLIAILVSSLPAHSVGSRLSTTCINQLGSGQQARGNSRVADEDRALGRRV
jgi:hypothetical protein